MLTTDEIEARRGRITGSLAAACLGLSRYANETPLSAWLRIIGEHPDDEDDDARARFRRGDVLEPALLRFAGEEIAKDTGQIVAMDRPGTIVHPDLPWAACTPDAVYTARPALDDEAPDLIGSVDDLRVPNVDGLIVYLGEAKTDAEHWSEWGEEWTGQIPIDVQIQAEWQALHVPEARAVIVPALIGPGMDLRMYVYEPDIDVRRSLVDQLAAWHARHVVRREPPPVLPKDNRRLHHVWRSRGLELPDDARIAALARLDDAARTVEREAKEHRDDYQAQIKQILQGHDRCSGPWGSVSWKEGKDGGRRFRNDYGKLPRAKAKRDEAST